jgi:RNA polymerase sigma factor (sigma-70 family)
MSAEDIVQEAYCRALAYIDSYSKERGSFDDWFKPILNRVFRDWKNCENTGYSFVEIKEHHLPSEEDMNERLKLYEEVCSKILKKDEKTKNILYLYYVKDYNTLDISKILDESHQLIRYHIGKFKNEDLLL